jgi:mannan endo-1,4-beta-mannosidase
VAAILDEAEVNYTAGGIVTLHYHWMKPGNPEGSAWVGGGRGTGSVDLAKAVTPRMEEHRAVMADLSVTADYLKQLADARVPVLWRPPGRPIPSTNWPCTRQFRSDRHVG